MEIKEGKYATMKDGRTIYIGETCWFISGSSPDGYVHYGAISLSRRSSCSAVR